MKLTGKCKQDFQNWYFNQEIFDDYYITYVPKKGMLDEFKCIDFKELPNSMQYGVYVDFFDSVGIYIQIETRIFDKEHPCYIYSKTVYNRVGLFKSRQQARTAAIEKANEIHNSNLESF
jgi:hypothetical protein